MFNTESFGHERACLILPKAENPRHPEVFVTYVIKEKSMDLHILTQNYEHLHILINEL